MTESVLEKGEAEVSEPGEDDGAGEEDLEALEVEAVELRGEPEQKIVEDGSNSGGGDSVYYGARQRGSEQMKRSH